MVAKIQTYRVKNKRKDGRSVDRAGFLFPGNGEWYTVAIPHYRIGEVTAHRDLVVGQVENGEEDGQGANGQEDPPNPTGDTTGDQDGPPAGGDGANEPTGDPDGSDETTSEDDEDEAVPYEEWDKGELVAECEARGLAKSGNMAELIERLEADDEAEDEE